MEPLCPRIHLSPLSTTFLTRCILLYHLLSHDVSFTTTHHHYSYVPSPATYVVVGINVNWGTLQHNQFNMILAGFTVLVSGGNTHFFDRF